MLSNDYFTALAERYKDTVFRVAFSYMKNRADAEDITQNVLLKLYLRDEDFDTASHLRHWLIRVTVNECKSAFRSPWRRVEPLEECLQAMELPSEEHEDLFRAVMALPAKYRVVIHLYYYEDLSTDGIAALLDIPAATVRTRLARARQRLKITLTEAELQC